MKHNGGVPMVGFLNVLNCSLKASIHAIMFTLGLMPLRKVLTPNLISYVLNSIPSAVLQGWRGH